MAEGAVNGAARPGSGAPHVGAQWGKEQKWGMFPAEGIRDCANWKGLELRGQEGGGDYLGVCS